MRGDHALNIYNAIAANFYQQLGLSTGTISNESPVKNTKELVTQTQLPMEMVVHGSPVVMYMSHDLYENTMEKAYFMRFDSACCRRCVGFYFTWRNGELCFG